MSCNSCSGVFEANPVQTDEEAIAEYWTQMEELGEQGMLPDLEAAFEYHVYTIQGGGFCGHKSVVLSSNNIHFVTVELDIRAKNVVRLSEDESFGTRVSIQAEISWSS